MGWIPTSRHVCGPLVEVVVGIEHNVDSGKGLCFHNYDTDCQEVGNPPCLGDVVFHAGGLPCSLLPPSLLPSECPVPFAHFHVSTCVLALVFSTS